MSSPGDGDGSFAGTASSYAAFRPRYPDAVWDAVLADRSQPLAVRALELGCGPGTATVDLARRVGSVVAVDVEPEMVRLGRRLADQAGLGNIEWIAHAAEDLDHPEGSFDLIVIASAFHWMDRPVIAAHCRSQLKGDGALVLLGNPTPLMQLDDEVGVGPALAEVRDRWFPSTDNVFELDEVERHETVLERAGYSVSVSFVDHVQEWTIEQFIGFLRSTSARPDRRLGRRFSRFAAELEAAARRVEPSGRWTLDIPVQVIVGRPSER